MHEQEVGNAAWAVKESAIVKKTLLGKEDLFFMRDNLKLLLNITLDDLIELSIWRSSVI